MIILGIKRQAKQSIKWILIKTVIISIIDIDKQCGVGYTGSINRT